MPFEFQPMRTKAELISDPQKLLEEVTAYFDYCESTRDERELKNQDIRIREVTPSILGLSQWLHCHRNTLNRLIDDPDSEMFPNLTDEQKEAHKKASDILAYVKQEIVLRLSTRALNGDAEDRVSQAMLARYGEIGEDKTNINLQISVAGASTDDVNEWSK